jgi:hypothetical protein
MGTRMNIPDLSPTYKKWLVVREQHLQDDLAKSDYTVDLYKQYKKHLGAFRFKVLKESQILVVPKRVNELLQLGKFSLLQPVVPIYKISRSIKLDWLIKEVLLPAQYKKEIKDLDIVPA